MLGDIINGIDPHGCVQLLRAWGRANEVRISCIKGNAEAYLTTPDRYALPKDEGWNQDMISLVQWWEDYLSEADLDWIRSLPDTIRWNDAYLVHDSPMDRLAVQTESDPDLEPQYREWFFHGRGIAPDMAERDWQRLLDYMDEQKIRQVFCGHTHVPFYREIDGKIICNIGSAGAPLDGDPRPSWVLLENTPAVSPVISIRRVTYDVGLIHRLIDDTPDYPNIQVFPGYREAYKMWFSTGIHWRAHLPKDGAGSGKI
jgi:diadenosine tetraphosphatase ApaH/serine/threonine PP2A family protein phosphatase